MINDLDPFGILRLKGLQQVEDIGHLLASSARDMPVEALPLTCTLSNTILDSTSNRPGHTTCANIIISFHHIVILLEKKNTFICDIWSMFHCTAPRFFITLTKMENITSENTEYPEFTTQSNKKNIVLHM